MTLPGRDIIVIGASAGGVEALKRFVAGLPADLPAAIFVVLHLWADGQSFLAPILGRSGPLPAFHPEDGDRIEHGRIYVAPPDFHLFVEEGRVRVLRGPRENRFRPAINPLFRSAATSYGPRVVGIILSGSMDDGTAGLWAIKQCGGLAVIQDPADAAFPEMPRNALENVEVDHVLPVAEIPPLVRRLASEPFASPDVVAPPPVVTFGDEAARMKEQHMDIDGLAKRSIFTCPECRGALWELWEGGLLSYRCHVGHAYSANTLADEQHRSLEASLWSALRALAESAALDERLAKRSLEHHLHTAAQVYQRNADEKKQQAGPIRQLLSQLGRNGQKEYTQAKPSTEDEHMAASQR